MVINIKDANKHDSRLAVIVASNEETNIHRLGNVDGKGLFKDHKRQDIVMIFYVVAAMATVTIQ